MNKDNQFAEEIGNLSPIRNMKEKRDMVSEIQKIAKEIKRIPTQDFRTDEFLQTSQNNNSLEEDSLLQELGNISNNPHFGKEVISGEGKISDKPALNQKQQ